MATTGASGRTVAGRYRLDRLIGRGGAGAVWRGHDERLNRPVAVKEISFPTDGPQAEIGQERALREARAAARLGDAGVVQIYDIHEEDDGAYLIMELVDAPTLSALVRRTGPLEPHTVAALGVRVLDTLVATHRVGIVHRDVKPSNVLIDGDVPRLTDFGIARLGDESAITSSGVVMGTPAYIAPEHARGEPVGPAADLYGLAATLYYAVEGTAPFGESSSVATVMAVLDRPPRRPRRAGPLTDLLDDLLVKDPAERPDAVEVRDRLVALRDGFTDDTAVPVAAAAADDAPADDDELPSTTTAHDAATADTDEVARAEVIAAGAAVAAAAADDTPTDDDIPPDGGTPDGGPPADDSGAGDAQVDEPEPHDLPPPAARARPSERAGRRPVALGVVALVALALFALAGLRSNDGGDDGRDDVQEPGAAGGVAAAAPSADATVPATAGQPSDAGGQAPASAVPSVAPTDAAETEPVSDGVLPAYDVEVPDDWVVLAPDGVPYQVAHPPGWQVVDRPGNLIDIRDPQTGTYLRLDFVAARRDPVGAWEEFEPAFADRFAGYRRIGIEPTTYKGDPAALWEYRYRSGGADLHAYNLGVNADDFGFALNLQARQGNFAAARELWPYFLASYEFTAQPPR
ncbi:hypothetical protein BH23ACT10_BH23ACT10_24680 [soil metagenome]